MSDEWDVINLLDENYTAVNSEQTNTIDSEKINLPPITQEFIIESPITQREVITTYPVRQREVITIIPQIERQIIPENNDIILTESERKLIPFPDRTPKNENLSKQIEVKTDTSLESKLKSSRISDRREATEELERRIVTMQGHCASEIVDDLKIRVFQLDPHLMGQYLKQTGTFDARFQNSMGCLVDALISDDNLLSGQRIREWIVDIRRIGKPSTEGTVFNLCYTKDCDSLFVVKTPNDPYYDYLPHEAVVGMGAINNLRNKIPNFMHTYAAFMCSPPLIDDNGSVLAWCPAHDNMYDENVTYLILENIGGTERNVKSLNDIVVNLTPNEYLAIYLQVLNALDIAYKEYDFTHYDLHGNNILVEILPYKVAIPFRGKYIITDKLARIIDFGFSHVKLQGINFGKYGLEEYGVDAEKSYPMHDAYKLLLNSYLSAINNKNRNLDNLVMKIYKFFESSETPQDRIRYLRDHTGEDFLQPLDDKYQDKTYEDLINYILNNISVKNGIVDKEYTYAPLNEIAQGMELITNTPKINSNFDFIVNEVPNDVILTVCNDKCVTWNGFIRNIFDANKLPTTLVDYCQALTAIDKFTDKNYEKSYKEWLSQVDIKSIYDTERINMINEINSLIDELNKIDFESMFIDDPNFNLKSYKQNLRIIFDLQSRYNKIILWTSTVKCVFGQLNYQINNDIDVLIVSTKNIRKHFVIYTKLIKGNMLMTSKSKIYIDQETYKLQYSILSALND